MSDALGAHRPQMESRFVERGCCPACLNVAASTVFRSGFTDEPLGAFLTNYYRQPIPNGCYQLDICSNCTLIFQRFVGTEEFLVELYSDWLVQGLDEKYTYDIEHYRESRDGHELISLSKYLGKPCLKVLDYGTGWGLWPIIARQLGHEAYATEWASHKAGWVKDHGVIVLSAEEIAQHRFDVINLEQTLEHLTAPRELIGQLAPSLEGVLKVAVPNVSNPLQIVKDLQQGNCGSILPLMPFEHINGFNSFALRNLVGAFGLVEAQPSFRDRYSFVPTGIPRAFKRMAKEFVRPLWTFRSRTNLYRWFVRPDRSRRVAAVSR